MLVYEIERVANDPSLGGKDSELVNALIEGHLKLCQERGDEIAFAGFIDLSGDKGVLFNSKGAGSLQQNQNQKKESDA